MPVAVKICGISTIEIYKHCASLSVDWVGFVFYEPSPRHLPFETARQLADQAERDIDPKIRPKRMALCVNPSDDELTKITQYARPDMLQLHGSETPKRVAEIKARFGLPVMPVIKIASQSDIHHSLAMQEVADWLLFDAAPPPQAQNEHQGLPGGRGENFDWSYLTNFSCENPWMLAGGLNPNNVGEAIAMTGASCVDVSSGVEINKGEKSKSAISAFVKAVKIR